MATTENRTSLLYASFEKGGAGIARGLRVVLSESKIFILPCWGAQLASVCCLSLYAV
jgi:methyl coenzyme M reductase beta subunit